MKYMFIFIMVISFSVISCSEKETDNFYGQCKEGQKRCSGSKLEKCSSFSEWTLETECDFLGGECVTDGNSSFCTILEDDTENSDSYITDWGEDEDDVVIEQDDDPEVADDEIYDYESSEDDDNEVFETDEEYDSDIVDDDISSICGNEILEEGEVCEQKALTDCTEIDPEKYSGGKAFCLDDCSGYNTVTCSEK